MKKLEEEIKDLKSMFQEMATSVEEMTVKSIKALKEKNKSLAEDVIKRDDKIDNMENEIEELCIKILALYQPEAVDLRTVTMIMEINKDIERIGDHAVDIATRAISLAEKPSSELFIEIPGFAEKAMEMLRDVLNAFVNKNADLAIEVRKKDTEVNSLHNRILGELETHILEDPRIIDQASQFILIVRDIERIADLTKNIAEDIFYIVRGKVLRHHFMEETQSLMRS